MDVFSDMAANLNFIDSNNYYGMLREEISLYLLPKHPIIQLFEIGRCIAEKVHLWGMGAGIVVGGG